MWWYCVACCSDLFAFSTAHGMWRARLVILSCHLLCTPCCWIHIWQICYFSSRWTSSSLFPIRAIGGLWACSLGFWAGGKWLTCSFVNSFFRLLPLLSLSLCDLLVMFLSDQVHDAGNFKVLRVSELSKDGLQFWALDQTSQLKVVFSTRLQITILKTSVFNQVSSPHTLRSWGSLAFWILELDAKSDVDGGWS